MISLVRIQAESAFCVTRASIQAALQMTSLNGPGRTVEELLPKRAQSDCLRAGLSHILQVIPAVMNDGSTLRIIRAEAKTNNAKEVRLDLHFQRRGSAVNYLHIGWFSMHNGFTEWTWAKDANGVDLISADLMEKVPQVLVDYMDNPQGLIALGENAFRSDVCKLADILLVQELPKLWPGTWLITSDKLHQTAKAVRQVLHNLSNASKKGKASLNLITLEDTQDNKETLGKELSDSFTKQLEEVRESLDDLDPDEKKYADKLAKVKAAFATQVDEANALQSHLGIEFSEEYYNLLVELTTSL